MKQYLLWFRKDLRLEFNQAFIEAYHGEGSIAAVYCYDEDLTLGAAQRWWLHHSLEALKKELQGWNIELHIAKGSSEIVLKDLVTHHQIDKVFTSKIYEPFWTEKDKNIGQMLSTLSCDFERFSGHLLVEPHLVQNNQGEYCKVFTPFWKKASLLVQMSAKKLPQKVAKPTFVLSSPHILQLENLNLCPTAPNWAKDFSLYWTPGAQGALQKWQIFLEEGLRSYKEDRNRPDKLHSTSFLSPHLALGEISVHHLWEDSQHFLKEHPEARAHVESFLSELGWREFSYHLLHHFPKLPCKNFRSQFDSFEWENNPEFLAKWQKGFSGIPIVDAGMRQLWKTGYMHNRVRMIVASFLTKHLLIDWQEGARWFEDTLVDIDLANNSASWQWVAGSGADAAPYFRIFNPTLQAQKFDPEGTYIKTWLPELEPLKGHELYEPWTSFAGQKIIASGKYPLPMIDCALGRKKALSAYEKISSEK